MSEMKIMTRDNWIEDIWNVHMNDKSDVICSRKNVIVDVWNVLFDQEELDYWYLQYISSLAIKC